MTALHPYYETHRDAMEATMRERVELADALPREQLQLADTTPLKPAHAQTLAGGTSHCNFRFSRKAG